MWENSWWVRPAVLTVAVNRAAKSGAVASSADWSVSQRAVKMLSEQKLSFVFAGTVVIEAQREDADLGTCVHAPSLRILVRIGKWSEASTQVRVFVLQKSNWAAWLPT